METAMKRNTLITMAIAAALAAPLAAQSADGDKGALKATPAKEKASASGRTSPSAALFERLDKNKDGFVTRDEARDATELQGRFAELDKDNDGKISASEMRELDSSRSATGR